jgi:hypothetical protein
MQTPSSGAAAEAIHRLTRQTMLNLKVVSWRLFFHRANREQSDDHVIEVRCRLDQPLLAGRIIVGTPSENLDSLRISIEICSDQSAPGWLRYNPPISSGDGVVDEKTGSVDGCVFFGNDTMREISRLLTLQPAPDIRFGVTVSLDRETSQMYSDRRWDGKELLEIEEAVIVAANAPVHAPALEPQSEESPMLIARAIADSVEKLTTLNTRIVNVSLFVAVIVVCILIELWRHHL